MNYLTAGELMELLKDCNPKMPVLVPMGDHQYRRVNGLIGTALHDRESGDWTEDHGEQVTPEADYGKRVPVVLIGV